MAGLLSRPPINSAIVDLLGQAAPMDPRDKSPGMTSLESEPETIPLPSSRERRRTGYPAARRSSACTKSGRSIGRKWLVPATTSA